MNDLRVTVTGWVATDPMLRVTPNGTHITSFRLASTARYFDRNKEEWVDRSTEWFTVKLFRESAVLVKESIAKGQPVIVHGRLSTDTWKQNDEPRTDLVLDAAAVGHDLTRGIASFTRAVGDTTSRDEVGEDGDGGSDDGEEAGVEEPVSQSA